MTTEIAPKPTWIRSSNGMIAGVCDGIARQFDLPTWVVRVAWLIAVLCFGTGLLLYLAFAISLPREDDPYLGMKPKILGVCTRIARRGDMEVGLARLVALFLLFASFGFALVLYVALAIFMPKYKEDQRS